MLTDDIVWLISGYKGNSMVAATPHSCSGTMSVFIRGRNREASKEQDRSCDFVANQEHERMICDELLLRRRCRPIRYNNNCGCRGFRAFLVNSDIRLVDYFRYIQGSSRAADSGEVGGCCEGEVHSHRLQYILQFLANDNLEARNSHRYPAWT